MIKLIILLLLFSCTNNTSFNQKESDVSRKLYEKQCSGCHGVFGTGDGPLIKSEDFKPLPFYEPDHKWKNGKSIAGITKTISTEPHITYYSYLRLIDVYGNEKNRKPMDEEIFLLAQYTMFIATISESIIVVGKK